MPDETRPRYVCPVCEFSYSHTNNEMLMHYWYNKHTDMVEICAGSGSTSRNQSNIELRKKMYDESSTKPF